MKTWKEFSEEWDNLTPEEKKERGNKASKELYNIIHSPKTDNMGENKEFISRCCIGEKCSVCGNPATDKIGEEIMPDDPHPIRHNLTAYVCKNHFNMILRPRLWKETLWNGPIKTIPTEVLREGVEVFGTEQEFKEWLDKPNAFLNFKKPSELSDKDVLDELARIKNGIT